MEINNKTAPVTGQQDQNNISLDLMSRMKLHGMAEAFKESLAGTTPQSMTADSFLSMLLAREWDYRAQVRHRAAYQECGVPIQGLSRTD